MELLLGIAIVGVLAAIGIPSYERYMEKTRMSQAVSDIRAMEMVIESYQLDFGEYPPPWRRRAWAASWTRGEIPTAI